MLRLMKVRRSLFYPLCIIRKPAINTCAEEIPESKPNSFSDYYWHAGLRMVKYSHEQGIERHMQQYTGWQPEQHG